MRLIFIVLLFAVNSFSIADEHSQITAEMKDTASQLMAIALEDTTAYSLVESLTTEIGPRLAGSEAEARARAWAVEKLESMGFENIRIEPFMVPFWQRGIETAEILSPYPQHLNITTLGGSTSTGPLGVEGEIISMPSLSALTEAEGGSLKGKIIFIDESMSRTQDGSGYGAAVSKRREAAFEGHRLGAKAVLIRSVGTSSNRFAHTGQMKTIEVQMPDSVPAAALSAPDADQLARILSRQQAVTVKIVLTPDFFPPAESGNVIAEIPGREKPEEIILIGAHLDSWDLGTGAVDDGAGVGIVVGAAKILMDHLPQAPKRTIRVVLFGSEEVGLVGAKAYTDRHKGNLANHIIAAESDFGADRIWRFDTRVSEDSLAIADQIGEVLSPLLISRGSNQAGGGPDLTFLREEGVPVVSLVQNGWDYFDLHHTPNDTLDKIDPELLAQNVAAYAAFTYLVAEIDEDFR